MYVVTQGQMGQRLPQRWRLRSAPSIRASLGPMATMMPRGERATSRRRTSVLLAGALAGLGVVLRFVGVSGVLSVAVARRMRAFGVRVTLGARPADIRRMVLREGRQAVRSRMKSRPRTTSAAFFTPPTNGMKSSAVSSTPPTAPLRRMAAPSVAIARMLPNHGAARSSRRATRRCPY
jgi:hypothetical protein